MYEDLGRACRIEEKLRLIAGEKRQHRSCFFSRYPHLKIVTGLTHVRDQQSIEHEGGAYEYVVDEDKCIGCGFCAGICPCGVWEMVENV